MMDGKLNTCGAFFLQGNPPAGSMLVSTCKHVAVNHVGSFELMDPFRAYSNHQWEHFVQCSKVYCTYPY